MHVIGTAGHVDHGKSTLVERLTGIDPDRFAEEKRRGLTIDLGFAWLPLPSGNEIGLIDVPGHERFIKNMLAGAGGVSICLFVVAANEGWKPQSAEHLAILDVLGVRNGVVAVTKSDLVDESELELVVADVKDRLAGTSLEGARVVACSAISGDGLDELVAALDEAVASAPSLVDGGRPRLWIDRVFTIAGAGTVVTGTLAGGGLAVGQEVEVVPEGRRARIRGIQSHKKSHEHIGPGNRVALNLVGLDRQGAERGDAVVAARQWRTTRMVDAKVKVLESRISGRDHELTEKGSHLLYIGTAETPVRIALLDRDQIGSGEEAFVQLHLRDPLPIGRGDRFVLRDAGRILTFGGGSVLDPLPERAKRRDADRVRLLERLDTDDPEAALETLVSVAPVTSADAYLRTGVSEPPLGTHLLGDMIVSNEEFESLASNLRAELDSYHREHPLERGAPKETLRTNLGQESDRFDALLAAVEDVVEDGATVHTRAHQVQLTPDQSRARDSLVAAIEGGGYSPPLASELQADADLLRALKDSGELVQIGDFFLTARQATAAREKVRSAIESNGPLTVAQIRDLLGTSRKYAVPLCEWLDQTGATRRKGDLRILGPHP